MPALPEGTQADDQHGTKPEAQGIVTPLVTAMHLHQLRRRMAKIAPVLIATAPRYRPDEH